MPRFEINDFPQVRRFPHDSPVASRRHTYASYALPRIAANNLQKGFASMFRRIACIAGVLLLAPLFLAPHGAIAFEAVDTLQRSSSGLYRAYQGDPLTPYELWAQFGMLYDNNMLRQSTGDTGDLLTRLGIGGRWDQRIIGRQGLHLDGEVDGYVYNKYSDIDNIAYRGLAEWRYEVGNDLAGGIGLSRRRFQAALNEIQRALYDPITETRAFANGRYLLGPHVALRGGLDFADYNRPSRQQSDTSTASTFGGVDYITNLGNIVGVEARYAKGDAPVNQQIDPLNIFVNNDFKQTDVTLLWTWFVSPQITFTGNYGRTSRTYTEIPGRDFDGPTWRYAVHWAPLAKAYLDFDASKHVSSIIDVGATHVVVRSYSIGPGWAITAKTNLQARFIRQELAYAGDPEAQFGVAPLREEVVRVFRLGSYWEYTRQVHFTAAWETGERESNVIGRDYRFNAVMANVRYIF